MARRPAELATEEALAPRGAGLDERWDAGAARLLESLVSGRAAKLDPELEEVLRRLIHAKCRRWARQLGARGLGIDVEDVVQRVLLQLLEHPPDRDAPDRHTPGRPMRRLVAWVNIVSHNYLCSLISRRAERLDVSFQPTADEAFGDRPSGVTESRYAARQALRLVRPAVEAYYPAGLPLLDLLLESPHATSQELAEALGTTRANVDQMRCRIRRVLRNRLGDFDEPPRRKK